MNLLKILLLIFLSASSLSAQQIPHAIYRFGGLERADTTTPIIHLAFTGHEYADGGKLISKTLRQQKIKAHFFFTGDFFRSRKNKSLIRKLIREGHYMGPHSDSHLLYASWGDRDSLLVTKEEFENDLLENYQSMLPFGISKKAANFFIPPYEWYNDSISHWALQLDVEIVNYTPGIRSNADYTTPDMGKRYVSSDVIYESIFNYEKKSSNGLNGFVLLIHIGTHPDRTDKFYKKLDDLLDELRAKGYRFGLLKRNTDNTD